MKTCNPARLSPSRRFARPRRAVPSPSPSCGPRPPRQLRVTPSPVAPPHAPCRLIHFHPLVPLVPSRCVSSIIARLVHPGARPAFYLLPCPPHCRMPVPLVPFRPPPSASCRLIPASRCLLTSTPLLLHARPPRAISSSSCFSSTPPAHERATLARTFPPRHPTPSLTVFHPENTVS